MTAIEALRIGDINAALSQLVHGPLSGRTGFLNTTTKNRKTTTEKLSSSRKLGASA